MQELAEPGSETGSETGSQTETQTEPAEQRLGLASAVLRIQSALELQPDHFRARHLKANFLGALQRGREAVALTRELLKERPEDGSLEMILLSGCLDTGETAEALELY